MSKITLLPESIANKIAAGEVVERPASVVKELLENGLDAKASRINIAVEQGGKKKIIVQDNGDGIDKKDIHNAVKRHSTSKIRTIEDLTQIASLGFRGEALASITSVSKLKIRSKIDSETIGQEIIIHGGKTRKSQPVGMATGTTVIVEDLYYNVPARKKFLKTDRTEFSHIIQIVSSIALSFPSVGIVLSHNGRDIMMFRESESKEERVKAVLGNTLANDLLAIYYDHPHLHIDGFVSKPQMASNDRNQQYCIVNRRSVRAPSVIAAVRGAFGTLLPQKSYPAFVLYLTLPYEMVDVNVHPRKEEVKFINNSMIFTAVKSAVSHTLEKADMTFQKRDDKKENKEEFHKAYQKRVVSTTPFSDKTYRKSPHPSWLLKEESANPLLWEKEEIYKSTISPEILQIHNLYLLVQSQNGLIIFDQHAAHERILYEQFLNKYKRERELYLVQPLLIPEMFDLPTAQAELLKEHKDVFSRLGFELVEFGHNSFKLNNIPNILKDQNAVRIIKEVLNDLVNEKASRDVDTANQQAIAFLACRSAVKAGDHLLPQERRYIIEKIAKTKTKYTCPHGRPVKVEISLRELQKMVKRR